MPQEPFLEPLARLYRFRTTSRLINKQHISVIDVGCGPNLEYYDFIKDKGIHLKNYIGIDPLINTKTTHSNKKIKLIKQSLNKTIPVKSNFADFVVAHAVLEHVNYPKDLLADMIRVTKVGGKIILTTPTPVTKYILEFLSFRLNLLSKREINEHKNYFNKNSFFGLIKLNKYLSFEHHYFEFGLNNLFIIEKLHKSR